MNTTTTSSVNWTKQFKKWFVPKVQTKTNMSDMIFNWSSAKKAKLRGTEMHEHEDEHCFTSLKTTKESNKVSPCTEAVVAGACNVET